jgi:hypothetical protein
MRSSPRGRCGRRSATLTHACGRVPRVCHSPGQGLVVCARSRWVCAPRAVVEKSGASRVSARVLRADPLLVRQFGCHESADRVHALCQAGGFPGSDSVAHGGSACAQALGPLIHGSTCSRGRSGASVARDEYRTYAEWSAVRSWRQSSTRRGSPSGNPVEGGMTTLCRVGSIRPALGSLGQT